MRSLRVPRQRLLGFTGRLSIALYRPSASAQAHYPHTHVGGSATVYHLALPAPTGETASPPRTLQCSNCQAVIDIPVDALDSLISRVTTVRWAFRSSPIMLPCWAVRRLSPVANIGRVVRPRQLATTFRERKASRWWSRRRGRECCSGRWSR